MGHRSTRALRKNEMRNEEPRADYGVTRLHRALFLTDSPVERKQNHRSGEQTRSGTVNDLAPVLDWPRADARKRSGVSPHWDRGAPDFIFRQAFGRDAIIKGLLKPSLC